MKHLAVKIKANSPVRLIATTIISILLINLILAMLREFLPQLPIFLISLINSLLLVVLIAPILYFLIFRPMVKSNQELKLKREEILMFKLGIEHSTNAVFITDTQGGITYANPTFEKIYGFSQEEILGKTPRILESGVLDPEIYTSFWETLLSKNVVDGEIINKTKDGRLIHIDESNNPIIDSNGNIIGFLGVHRDISENKQVELERNISMEITNSVTATSNLEELLNLLHVTMEKNLYAENCFFALYDEKTGLFSFPYFVDKFDAPPMPNALTKSCTSYVYRTGKSTIFTPDLLGKLIEQKEIELTGTYSPSWLGVPLKTSSGTIGVMVLQHYEKENIYNESHLRFLDVIGSEVANVIEHKRSEKALRESEEKFRTFFEKSPIGIEIYDANGIQIDINKAGLQMFGIRDKNNSLGFKLFEETSLTAEAKEKLLRGDSIEYMASFDFNKIKALHQYETMKTGEAIMQYIITPFKSPESSKISGYILLVKDITERKKVKEALQKSEERFRNIFENSILGIYRTSKEGKILLANSALVKMLGYSSFEELRKRDFEKIYYEPEYERSNFIENIEKEGVVNGIESQWKRKDKSTIYVRESARVFRDKNGEISFYEGIVEDISNLKQAEQMLKQSEARLRELNATKDKFFSIIAHDLKSPFNSIVGFSNLLIEQIHENDFDAIEKYAGIIQDSSERAMDLLLNLLEWSRSQTNRIEFSPEYIEMVSLINEAIALLNESADLKSISITHEMPNNLPVFADKAMIATIMRNLISNAIKFTNLGGKIVISAEQGKDETVISVTDNGVGIKNDALEKIFRIEEDYSTKGTQNEKGTGLGLILCKEFVEKHGGRIWVESEEGKGSDFKFTLPSNKL